MKKIIILNGPNLNLLGEREKSQYGSFTLEDVEKSCKQFAERNSLKLTLFQSNIEGELVEKILECDEEAMNLKYSAIKTMAPIKHHLAQINLIEDGEKTLFRWSTEIDPPEFSEAIRAGMLASLDKLEEIVSNQ